MSICCKVYFFFIYKAYGLYILCHCLLFQVRFDKNSLTFVASVATFTFLYQCELYNVHADLFTHATNIAIPAVDFCLKKKNVVVLFKKQNNDNETPNSCLYCEKYEYSLQYLYEFEVELETAAHPSSEIYLFSGTERM